MLADAAAAAALPRTKSGIPITATPIPAAALSNADADLLGHVLERSKPVTLSLELDCGYDGSDATSYNVIGEITGSAKPDELVMIGGHLDSWDLGTGAIDDGAGVAIAIAAGQALLRDHVRPRRTIRVVAFANEEQGLWGGKAYAAAHGGEVARHVLAAESDLGADRIYRFDSGVADEALPAIEAIARVLAPLGIERGDNQGGEGPDIGAMGKLGMPMVSLHQDATRYFDLHHTANDTLDKVDGKSMDTNVAAYAVLIYLAAQADVGFARRP
jgi:Zn-dependent M28 family amino/carboxypeptidase